MVGVGLNATDTLLLLPKFPAYSGKVPFTAEILSPGGQVATAIVACAQLGLRTKYIGTTGDDERGRVQRDSLAHTGVDISDVEIRKNCANQSAYILIDQTTGERTVLWQRPEGLRLDPARILPEQIQNARLLHVDGYDTAAVAKAAALARQAGVPVTVDVDTVYHGFDSVLANTDYLIASSEWPGQWTNEPDPFEALRQLKEEYKMQVSAMTLGAHGALALTDEGYIYSPAFIVNCLDTTGAGDVFHGAFCYALLQQMPMESALEFSNAMAALNCKALGARGHLATLQELEAFRNRVSKGEIAKRIHAEIAERSGWTQEQIETGSLQRATVGKTAQL